MNNGNDAANTRICPACGQVIDENGYFVVCPECGAAHHKDCWFTLGGCSVKGFEHKKIRVASVERQAPIATSIAEDKFALEEEPTDDTKNRKKRKIIGNFIILGMGCFLLLLLIIGRIFFY